MRTLTAILLIAAAGAVFGGTSIRRETLTTNGRSSETILHIVTEEGERDYAMWKRDGVEYVTYDASVITELREALQDQTAISRKHAELGRRHAALGRDHASLGRDHASLGRDHARLGRSGNYEAQREFERKQRELERKQQELERQQRALEREQQELERQQRKAERDADEAIERVFERAVREGKAKRR